jgi:SOS-response transcriptional repressor LexA
MASLHCDGRTWDFSRCSLTGRVTLWPREACPTHCVGGERDEPGISIGPVLAVVPNLLNHSVRMVRLAQDYRRWAGARPVAVAGEVAAGRFDVTVAYRAGPDAEEVLFLPPQLASPDCFALRVRGVSMRDAGIEDGDYVLVRPQSRADNGDFVIAAAADADDPEGYVTLKQFFWEGDHIRLQPANASMAPIHLYPQRSKDPIQVQGVVVGAVRFEDEVATAAVRV